MWKKGGDESVVFVSLEFFMFCLRVRARSVVYVNWCCFFSHVEETENEDIRGQEGGRSFLTLWPRFCCQQDSQAEAGWQGRAPGSWHGHRSGSHCEELEKRRKTKRKKRENLFQAQEILHFFKIWSSNLVKLWINNDFLSNIETFSTSKDGWELSRSVFTQILPLGRIWG